MIKGTLGRIADANMFRDDDIQTMSLLGAAEVMFSISGPNL